LLFELLTGCAPCGGCPGELDNIVPHAPEKLPARRYPGVENFARQIRRRLAIHLHRLGRGLSPGKWLY
jgi:hypothetical protein